MNKDLNIIEASKIKNTEFEIIFPNGDVGKKKVHTNEKGAILNAKNEYLSSTYFLINAKFIPVPKPVSFIEAVKTERRIKVEHNLIDDILSNGKDIYFRSNSSYNREAIKRFRKKEFMPANYLFSALGYLFDESEIAEIITDGKW